jgi:hypothetical protein
MTNTMTVKVQTTSFTTTTKDALIKMIWPNGVSMECRSIRRKDGTIAWGNEYRFTGAQEAKWQTSKQICLSLIKIIKKINGLESLVLENSYGDKKIF